MLRLFECECGYKFKKDDEMEVIMCPLCSKKIDKSPPQRDSWSFDGDSFYYYNGKWMKD